jgi:alpha-methylacyl-CoA racemase
VVRVDRTSALVTPPPNVSGRGRRGIVLDLKDPAGVETALQLMERADGVFEGFRPGVMERLGLGPDVALRRNPRLVYGRATGWGQDGPLAARAGHDINYIALAGALHTFGPPERPIPPLNIVGDYGGGGLYLALGLLAAILEARRSGQGQVIDCAMVDGAAHQMTTYFEMHSRGRWSDRRGENDLDGGAPGYATYECADGKWLALGAFEPEFYENLVRGLGLDPAALGDRRDPARREAISGAIAARVRTKTRDEWSQVFAEVDACVAPVLTLGEAPGHPANIARRVFVEVDGGPQPAPAPRFSRTPSEVGRGAPKPGAHTAEVLREWLGQAPPIAQT